MLTLIVRHDEAGNFIAEQVTEAIWKAALSESDTLAAKSIRVKTWVRFAMHLAEVIFVQIDLQIFRQIAD